MLPSGVRNWQMISPHWLPLEKFYNTELEWLYKPIKMIENNVNALAYCVICPCTVHHESVMFYETGH